MNHQSIFRNDKLVLNKETIEYNVWTSEVGHIIGAAYVEAIKYTRNFYQCSLVEARELVETTIKRDFT